MAGNLRQPDCVKGGIVLVFSEKTALGSRSRHRAREIAKKPARPDSTLMCRTRGPSVGEAANLYSAGAGQGSRTNAPG